MRPAARLLDSSREISSGHSLLPGQWLQHALVLAQGQMIEKAFAMVAQPFGVMV